MTTKTKNDWHKKLDIVIQDFILLVLLGWMKDTIKMQSPEPFYVIASCALYSVSMFIPSQPRQGLAIAFGKWNVKVM